jgi:hypothetical protein
MDDLCAALTHHISISLDGEDYPIRRQHAPHPCGYGGGTPMETQNLIKIEQTSIYEPVVTANACKANRSIQNS